MRQERKEYEHLQLAMKAIDFNQYNEVAKLKNIDKLLNCINELGISDFWHVYQKAKSN